MTPEVDLVDPETSIRVGMVSLGDLAQYSPATLAGEALRGVENRRINGPMGPSQATSDRLDVGEGQAVRES
jgi:hypothetical protein